LILITSIHVAKKVTSTSSRIDHWRDFILLSWKWAFWTCLLHLGYLLVEQCYSLIWR